MIKVVFYMANFQVTIYFNNEGDLTQSLVLDVSADDEDEAIELAEEEVQDYIDDYGTPYKYKAMELDDDE